MAEDKRGVLRGQCCADNCDCTIYERDDSIGLSCGYCSHSPAQHAKITFVEVKAPTTLHDGKCLMVDDDAIIISKEDLIALETEADCVKKPPDAVKPADASASSAGNSAELSRVSSRVDASDETSSLEGNSSDTPYQPQSSSSSSSDSSVPPVKKPRLSGKVSKPSVSRELTFSKEDIVSCLPEILPRTLRDALDPELEDMPFTNSHRCILVREIASRLNAKGFKKKAEVEVAADEAIKRWGSPLKCQFGKENAALTSSVMERINKLNRSSYAGGKAKSSGRTRDPDINHDEAAASMVEEMGKAYPSMTVLKSLLKTTRKARREEIEKSPSSVSNILKRYPALKKPDLLLLEFETLVDKSIADLTEAWDKLLVKLIPYCNAEKTCPHIDASLPSECQQVVVLRDMHLIVKGGKKSTQRRRRILEVFDNSSSDNVPNAEDPPRLVAVGDPNLPSLNIVCYADGQALAETTNPSQALMYLLASYWVFDIQFCVDAKAAFLFLSAACLGNKAPAEVSKYTTVTNLLNKLRLHKP